VVTPGSWALQQLVRYLAELTPGPDAAPDQQRTLRVGMERAAEALDAEVAAVVWDGEVFESLGFGAGPVPVADILAVAEGRAGQLDVTGLGRCPAVTAIVGRQGHLVLGRSGGSWDREEETVVRALGRILGLSLRAVDAVEAERSLRRESERRAREALRDPLTRLPNRALFLDRLERSVRRALRKQSSVGVLFMDMDGFKVVNDTLGHAAGDDLMRLVAGRLSDVIRSADTVARLGGDEFAVLIDDLQGLAAAEGVAERIREAMAAPFPIGGRQVSVGLSIGIAVGPRPGESPDLLLRDADLAMYRAKAEEPGGWRIFVPAMHEELVERLELESELREAVGGGGLRCYYQPIVELRTGEVHGLEALVRWAHPHRGLLAPDAFLGLADRAGLMTALGNWVLEETCRQVSRWQRLFRLPATMAVGVNLATAQLAWSGMAPLVARNIAEWKLDPQRLVLEITETAVMAAEDRAQACLADLRDLGVRIALDDFGTGYSSLSRLRELPVEVLKIDRSFVAGFPTEQKVQVLTANIIRLARELDLVTVAEGVETPDQRQALVRYGCDFAQGYLFAPPLAPEAVDELFAVWPELPAPDVSVTGDRPARESPVPSGQTRPDPIA